MPKKKSTKRIHTGPAPTPQSGVLPVLDDSVVLITSRGKGRWTIPKGFIKKGMSAHESAANEALEEAGLIGEVGAHPLGTYQYEKMGGLYRVRVYPMEVTESLDEWLESHQRQRIVVPAGEAADLIWHPTLRDMIYSHVLSSVDAQ